MNRCFSLETVLKNSNTNGEVYLSDVARWVELRMDINKVRQLTDRLTEMRDIDGKDK